MGKKEKKSDASHVKEEKKKTDESIAPTPGAPYISKTVVDRVATGACFAMYANSPAVQIATSKIMSYVFADGIEINRMGKKVNLTPEFRAHLEKYYVPFGQHVIKWILCAGLVPVSFHKLEHENMIIPIVMEHGTGDVVFTMDRGVKKFGWKYDNEMSISDQVIVISGFDNDPDCSGKITSKINCLLPLEASCATFLDCATRAEIVSSHPKYILQTTKEAYKNNNGPAAQYSYCAEFDAVTERDERKMYRMDIEPFRGMSRLRPTGKCDDTDGDMSWKTNQFVLPEDMQLVNPPQPKVRTDLGPMTDAKDKRICHVLGVPDFTHSGAGRIGSRESSSINEGFKSTIIYWKTKVASVLTRMYNEIYGDEDLGFSIDELDEHHDISLFTNEEVSSLIDGKSCSLNLPITPFLGAEGLTLLWESGVMTDIEFLNWMRKTAMLPPMEKVPKEMIQKRKALLHDPLPQNKRSQTAIVFTDEEE